MKITQQYLGGTSTMGRVKKFSPSVGSWVLVASNEGTDAVIYCGIIPGSDAYGDPVHIGAYPNENPMVPKSYDLFDFKSWEMMFHLEFDTEDDAREFEAQAKEMQAEQSQNPDSYRGPDGVLGNDFRD